MAARLSETLAAAIPLKPMLTALGELHGRNLASVFQGPRPAGSETSITYLGPLMSHLGGDGPDRSPGRAIPIF
jgi:hypothetical protein